MGKEKSPKLKIKTARYFTKNCSNCSFEYPNWFTNCPKCGASWDDAETKAATTITEDVRPKTKKIKIVVKITEEEYNQAIERVQLLFSADQGKSWYQMRMDIKMDYFIVEIPDVPIGSVIIYFIEVHLVNGDKVIENNEGKYFYYQVGVPITEVKAEPTQAETQVISENIRETPPAPQEFITVPDSEFTPIQDEKEMTIFGKPQTQVDPNLKLCPHCKSKIKKMWSICPICGGQV
jgi:hypothetical protein